MRSYLFYLLSEVLIRLGQVMLLFHQNSATANRHKQTPSWTTYKRQTSSEHCQVLYKFVGIDCNKSFMSVFEVFYISDYLSSMSLMLMMVMDGRTTCVRATSQLVRACHIIWTDVNYIFLTKERALSTSILLNLTDAL